MPAREAMIVLGACVLLVAAGGCGQGAPTDDLCTRMNDEDPCVRTRAVCQAGRTKDSRMISCLIDRLGDDEPAVRMMAIVALDRIAGQTMGYRFHAPTAERDEAIARWRRWLERKVAGSPSSAPAEVGR